MGADQDTILLPASRKRWTLLLLGAVVLVVASAAEAISGNGGFNRIVDWFGVVFFCLGVMAAIANLITNGYLMLTEQGFRSSVRKPRRSDHPQSLDVSPRG